MTRELSTIPDTLFDRDGNARWGSYRGAFDRVDLGHVSVLDKLVRRKRWMWMAITSGDALFCACVVDLGYAANAFAFVYAGGEMLVDRSVIAPRARVTADGRARIGGALDIVLSPDAMRVRGRDLRVDAELDAATAPPAITAVARAGKINVTQKRALLAARGTASAGGRTFSLDRGLGGYDFTYGLLARHTAWKWAFAVGRDASGAPIAFNLVDGFVGASECALFRGDATTALDEARVALDDPMRPWRVTSSGVDLTFTPGGLHAVRKNLVLVRSRFVQAAGRWSGTIHGTEIEDVLGVAEDQDVHW